MCACTEPAIVTQGTPIYKDSHVVVVPAYGKVSKLHRDKTTWVRTSKHDPTINKWNRHWNVQPAGLA